MFEVRRTVAALEPDTVGSAPVMEELDVPPVAVSAGHGFRIWLVVAMVAALVGWAYLGDDGATVPGLVSADAGAIDEGPAAGIEITEPVHQSLVSPGRPVRVTGTAPSTIGPLVVTVSLGALPLGQAPARLQGTAFAADVAILAPRAAPPVPLQVTVTSADAPWRVLGERSFRLVSAPMVTVAEVTVGRDARGVPVARIAGVAGPAVDTVLVQPAGPDGTAQTALVAPISDPLVADAARLLGLGRWSASVPLAHATSPTRVLIRWDDGTLAGGSTTVSLPGPVGRAGHPSP